MPRIRSRFAKMEPRRDACTIRISFFGRVSASEQGRALLESGPNTYLDKSNSVYIEVTCRQLLVITKTVEAKEQTR